MRRSRSLIALVGTLTLVVAALPAHARNGTTLDAAVKGTKHSFGPIIEPTQQTAMAQAAVNRARNLARLAATGAAPSAQSGDVDVDGDGTLDVAVVVDNGSIIIPPRANNPLDLTPGTRLTFTPDGSDSYAVTFESGQSLDPTLGADLGLGDDAATEVSLSGNSFSFLGTTYSSVFVGSDGHVTLGEGDASSSARNAARHVGGPPRLSALLTDLDPTCAGSVHADVRSDRAVVTWNGVVHFERGAAEGCSGVPTSTVQANIFYNGTVQFTYGPLDTGLIGTAGGNREAVAGIAEGHAEGPLNELDLTADPPVTLPAGAIFEEFSPASPEAFDVFQLGQEFYRTHDDKYDYLVFFTDFAIGGGGTAFHLGVQNQTLGLRQAVFDVSSLAGSDGELESLVFMNNIYLWAGTTADGYTNPPVRKFAVTTNPRLTSFLGGNVTPNSSPYESFGMLDITGPGNATGYSHHGRALIHENPNTDARASQGAFRYGLNSAMSIMFQEADHRWGAFTVFRHPTKGISIPDSFDLLGRDLAHWSTFFNTTVTGSPFTAADGRPRFSGMEGNSIIEIAVTAGGAVTDKNNPTRVLADPKGKIAQASSACAGQGKGLFLTEPDELIDGATELDQYLMGVRTAADVSPFWFVDEPSSPATGAQLDDFPVNFVSGSTFNVDDIGFCGKRVDLTVDDITVVGDILNAPTLGKRVPAIGDENDIGPVANCLAANLGTGPCADVKTMAFVLLVRSGPPQSAAHQPAIKRLNEFRTGWQNYIEGPALGGRNADGVVRPPSDPAFIPKFDTSLEPTIH